MKYRFITFNTIKAGLDLPTTNKTSPLTILNMGATSSLRGTANFSAYAVAKSALRVLSQSLAKEHGSKMVHVAYIVVDGIIDNARFRANKSKIASEALLSMDAISVALLQLMDQHPSCWTFELDLRPYLEKW